MKTKIMALALMVLVLGLPMSLAQTNEEGDGGVTPDSALYGLDKALDSLSLALTFNKEKRAEKALKVAEERLNEVKTMIEQNKIKHAEKAQKEHEKALRKTGKAIDDLESNGNIEKSKKAVEKITKLQKGTMSHAERVETVKNKILERQRERMTPEQIAKLEEVFGKIIEKAEETETKTEIKKENAVTKYKTLSKKTDAEVNKEVDEIEKEAGLENKENKNEKASEAAEAKKTGEEKGRK